MKTAEEVVRHIAHKLFLCDKVAICDKVVNNQYITVSPVIFWLLSNDNVDIEVFNSNEPTRAVLKKKLSGSYDKNGRVIQDNVDIRVCLFTPTIQYMGDSDEPAWQLRIIESHKPQDILGPRYERLWHMEHPRTIVF